MTVKLPPRTTPPRELLPEEVILASAMLHRWLVGSLVAGGAWAVAIIGGLIPFIVNLVGHGWQAVAGPTAAILLAPPLIWGLVRHRRRERHQAARALTSAWRSFPHDARWTSSLVLAKQMDHVADSDPETRRTLRRLVAALLAMFRELESFDRSIEADRQFAEHGGDTELHTELVALRHGRSEAITQLIDAMRKMHLSLARRHAVPEAMREDIHNLLEQLDAEREVDGLVGLGARASKLLGEPLWVDDVPLG